MVINLNNLKEKTIRKEFIVESGKIIVKNPTPEQHEKIIDKFRDYISLVENKINITIRDLEILKFLFNELVFVIDEKGNENSLLLGMSNEEIESVFKYPNEVLENINYEVTEIVKRLAKNSVREYINQLETLEDIIEKKELINRLDLIKNEGQLNTDLIKDNTNNEFKKENKVKIRPKAKVKNKKGS